MLFELMPDKKQFSLTSVSIELNSLIKLGCSSTYPFTIVKYVEKKNKQYFDFCVICSTLHENIDVQDMQISILEFLNNMLKKIEK